jgi:hypothetical protein
MRAKNEFRNIAETYDTKLILERVVDGKLMCPEACCGSPVLECKCGEDCEHCNCFMIQKAIKNNGLTDKLLKEYHGDGEVVSENNRRLSKGNVILQGLRYLLGKGARKKQAKLANKGATVRLGPAQAAPSVPLKIADKAVDVGKFAARSKIPATIATTGAQAATGTLAPDQLHAPELPDREDIEDAEDLSGGWESSRDRAGEMEAKEEAMREKIAKIIAKRKKDKYDQERKDNIEYSKRYKSENAESDAGLWRDQMKHQPDVSPEEVKRLKKRKPKPQSYSKKHPKREDNEEPERSITGMKHKLDALAAAQLAGSKHKPYVSSFVGDGGRKIFAILGSDGKIAHKTRDKQKAYKWLKDNYENI